VREDEPETHPREGGGFDPLSEDVEREVVEAALWAEFDTATEGKPHPTHRPDAYTEIPPAPEDAA
jgi:hypothetical protein